MMILLKRLWKTRAVLRVLHKEQNMAEYKGEDFKFPDEKEPETQEELKFEVEVEDDTPEPDRGRKPAPPPENVTDEELASYDEKVQQRIKKFTRGYHDERRAKEEAIRASQAAEEFAKQVWEQNQQLQKQLEGGSTMLVKTAQENANGRLSAAKAKFKAAFEAGDADALADAQAEVADAASQIRETSRLRPYQVKEQPQYNPPQQQKISPRSQEWLQNNSEWFGPNDEMTMAAMGIDRRLQKEYGAEYVGSEKYFQEVDTIMRKRFPEYFGAKSSDEESEEPVNNRAKSATVVAPASRSTPPSRIRLKASQVALARKLGITPEQYAKQVALINRGE
jgi:hypothetical protein